MPLFSLEREVSYSNGTNDLFRSRVFWVSKDGLTALAIPMYELPSFPKTAYWKKYVPTERVVSNWAYTSKYINNEVPFMYHYIKASGKTRVKFIGAQPTYHWSYTRFNLNLHMRYARNLPEKYYGQYIKTCYLCDLSVGSDYCLNRYGD